MATAPAASARRRRGIERPSTRAMAAQPAAAIAECPEGNDEPAEPMRWATPGRSRSMSHLSELFRMFTPRATVTMKPITPASRYRR
jgi:hypothetical protein